MRIYYIFNIKESFHKTYKNNPEILYKMLEKLYNLEVGDLNYGINIFNKMCYLYNTKVINHFIKEKYNPIINKNKYLLKYRFNVLIEINKSVIVMKTKYNIPPILRDLNLYSRRLLVCDFKSKDYFWLNNYINYKSNILS